jgi:alkylhydroperoxidase/carboxymuconolactone decarboxylase family protein YurZ
MTVESACELLGHVAACDVQYLRAALSNDREQWGALDRVTRALVRLAALIATDAGTTSLRWAVDEAARAGADDAALVQVLVSAATAAGAAQAVLSAPRLALALDVDIELEGWDGD